MRAIVIHKQFDTIPLRRERSVVTEYEGILNSEFKQIAKENFNNSKPTSVFAIKQRVKSNLYNYSSNIDAVLKLTVFAIVLACIL